MNKKKKQKKDKYLVTFSQPYTPRVPRRNIPHEAHKPNKAEIHVGYLDGCTMSDFQMVVEATSHNDAREKANRRIQQHYHRWSNKACRATASSVYLMDDTFKRRGEYWYSPKFRWTLIPDLYPGDMRG